MQRIFTLATALTLLFAGTTAAQEDHKIKVGGLSIMVDSNGDVQVEKSGDADGVTVIEGLPQDIQEKLKAAMKDFGGNEGMWSGTFGQLGNGVLDFKGKAVIIGPDGQKQEFNLGGDGGFDAKMMDGLPESLQQAIEKALGKTGQLDNVDVDFDVDFKGKVIVAGPDGKKREIDLGELGDIRGKITEGLSGSLQEIVEKAMAGDLENLGNSIDLGGKAIVVGPDGESKTIDITIDGDFNPADLFKNLPQEAQEAIKQAMENDKASGQSSSSDRNRLDTNEDLRKEIRELKRQIDELRSQLDK